MLFCHDIARHRYQRSTPPLRARVCNGLAEHDSEHQDFSEFSQMTTSAAQPEQQQPTASATAAAVPLPPPRHAYDYQVSRSTLNLNRS